MIEAFFTAFAKLKPSIFEDRETALDRLLSFEVFFFWTDVIHRIIHENPSTIISLPQVVARLSSIKNTRLLKRIFPWQAYENWFEAL